MSLRAWLNGIHHAGNSFRTTFKWSQSVTLALAQLAGRSSLHDIVENNSVLYSQWSNITDNYPQVTPNIPVGRVIPRKMDNYFMVELPLRRFK